MATVTITLDEDRGLHFKFDESDVVALGMIEAVRALIISQLTKRWATIDKPKEGA